MGVSPQPSKADHLCVLVHGLWGNPKHLKQLAKALRDKYSEDRLHILVTNNNSQYFTYDGIDVGGERVAHEIEETLDNLSSAGHTVTKLSVVGYSLGGLIARYAIGLLYSRGWLVGSPNNNTTKTSDTKHRQQLQPINFTAFASPFLGTRTPVRGLRSAFFNVMGGRTLSASGSQLFLLDSFRDTGRPLLSVLADPNSVFIRALALFKNRALYANIQNDRSAPYFTTSINSRDPYEDLSLVDLHPLQTKKNAYSPVVLDPKRPVSLKQSQRDKSSNREKAGLWPYLKSTVQQLPLYAAIALLSPLAVSGFLLNSGFQTLRSVRRMRLHNDEAGLLGAAFKTYRIPLMVEGAVESAQAVQPTEHLPQNHIPQNHIPQNHLPQKEDSEENENESDEKTPLMPPPAEQTRKAEEVEEEEGADERDEKDDFPTLALAPAQFEMIRHLDAVGWRKYAVNIQRVRHTHAAIIVRMERESFAEGRVVIGHWVGEEFEI